ncbi:MAG: DNA replication endonuclease-helicase Dna2 [Amphiamblys sp. WSBS2006]|nr:MAG: DNA replication endonuclease-helicase Dna2 [Amphiamblys sp. WSBS2006]
MKEIKDTFLLPTSPEKQDLVWESPVKITEIEQCSDDKDCKRKKSVLCEEYEAKNTFKTKRTEDTQEHKAKIARQDKGEEQNQDSTTDASCSDFATGTFDAENELGKTDALPPSKNETVCPETADKKPDTEIETNLEEDKDFFSSDSSFPEEEQTDKATILALETNPGEDKDSFASAFSEEEQADKTPILALETNPGEDKDDPASIFYFSEEEQADKTPIPGEDKDCLSSTSSFPEEDTDRTPPPKTEPKKKLITPTKLQNETDIDSSDIEDAYVPHNQDPIKTARIDSCSKATKTPKNNDTLALTATYTKITRTCTLVFCAEKETNRKRILLLKAPWEENKINTGDTLHVIGPIQTDKIRNIAETDSKDSDNDCIVLDPKTNTTLLVINPEILLQAKIISQSVECLRRAFINHTVELRRDGLFKKEIVVGIIAHAVFEKCLQSKTFDTDTIKKTVKEVLEENTFDIFCMKLCLEEIEQKLSSCSKAIASFGERYMGDTPVGKLEQRRTTKIDGIAFTKTRNIEESHVSEKYGVVARMDAVFDAVVGVAGETALRENIPFELKSGMNPRTEDYTQTIIYTMLLAEGKEDNFGLLYYLASERLIEVPFLHHEVAGITKHRNNLASAIKYGRTPRIPKMAECEKCSIKEICDVYGKMEKENEDETKEKKFFRKWIHLINKTEFGLREKNRLEHVEMLSKKVQRGNIVRLLYPKQKKLLSLLTGREDEECLERKKSHCKEICTHETLNSDQAAVFQKIHKTDFFEIVNGFPGTGKTTLIDAAVRSLVEKGLSVVITAQTNVAVDTILRKLKQNSKHKILRIGNKTKTDKETRCFLFQNMTFGSLEEARKFVETVPIVAGTSYTISKTPLNRMFDYCIVDEASQLTLPETAGPISAATKFVLVGDTKQLPPISPTGALPGETLSMSLFEILSDRYPSRVSYLSWQYRMNKDILLVANKLVYSDRLRCAASEVATRELSIDWNSIHRGCLSPREFKKAKDFLFGTAGKQKTTLEALEEGKQAEKMKKTCWITNTLFPQRKVVFLDTDQTTSKETKTPEGSFTNQLETEIISALCKELKNGSKENTVGVLTPFTAQKKQMIGAGIPASTIDEYQGNETDCIIVSLVRQNSSRNPGKHILDFRRINVAFTRARKKLIVVGARNTIGNSKIISSFISLADEMRWTVPVTDSCRVFPLNREKRL